VTAEQVSAVFPRWFGESGVMPPDMAARIADGINQAHAQHLPNLAAACLRVSTPTSRTAATERTPGALPAEDLLPQDVCVPAVLGEFAQYVEVHPAQRERAEPVAVHPVVQPQG
jgi:hypothetical protein